MSPQFVLSPTFDVDRFFPFDLQYIQLHFFFLVPSVNPVVVAAFDLRYGLQLCPATKTESTFALTIISETKKGRGSGYD